METAEIRQKFCNGCQRMLPWSSYKPRYDGTHRVHSRCRGCLLKQQREYAKRWRLEHPEKWLAIAKRARDKETLRKSRNAERLLRLRRARPQYRETPKIDGRSTRAMWAKYGLSVSDYLALKELAGGKCAICGKTPPDGLKIDHDHQTGRVRELLCNLCNSMVGYIEKHGSRITKCYVYVRKHERPNASAGKLLPLWASMGDAK